MKEKELFKLPYFSCKKLILTIILYCLFCCVTFSANDSGLLGLFSSQESVGDLFISPEMETSSFDDNKRVDQGVVKVTAIQLRTIKPDNLLFKGQVSTVSEYNVSFTKSGLLSYISSVGDYVFCSVIDAKGKVVRKGSAIALLDEGKLQEDAQDAIKKAKLVEMGYRYLEKMTNAQENLAENDIITPFELESSKITLFSSVLNYELTRKMTEGIIFASKDPNIYSTQSGMVTEVMATPGDMVEAGNAALRVVQMDPVSVKVKCPVGLLGLKHKKETALVYPNGVNRPVSVMIDVKEGDNSNIYMNVPNKVIISEKLTSKQKNLAKVFSIYPVKDYLNPNVESFYLSLEEYKKKRKVLKVVPEISLRYDDEGCYVYKIKNIKPHGMIDKVPRFFKIEKQRVEVLDFSTTYCYGLDDIKKICWIESKDNLNVGDIIVGSAQPNLKDGNEVVRVSFFWEFYPGQNVKVKIPRLTRPGIYVPLDAILHQDSGEDYIYLIKNNVAKLEKVNIIGFYQSFCLITGANIKQGERAIVIDDKYLLNLLYDGRKVKVVDTEDAPIFMENKHVMDFKTIESSDLSDINSNLVDPQGQGGMDLITLMKLNKLKSL